MIKDEIKWMWRAWRGNRLQACLNAALGLLDVAVQLAQVWAMKHAIDVACHDIDGSLMVAVAIMAALVMAAYAISAFRIWIRNILGVKAQNRMQQRLLATVLRARWQGRSEMHSGDTINRLETDVQAVVTFLTETIPNALSTITLFVSAFLYLFSMDRLLAVIVIIMLPLFALGSRVFMNRIRALNRAVRNSDSMVQSILQETVQNRIYIKAQNQENTILERLENTHGELRRNVKKKARFSVASFLIMNGGFALTYLVAFVWAALRMSAGTLSFGGMTAFLQLVNKVQMPARNLTRMMPQFINVLTAVERLKALEEQPMESDDEMCLIDGALGIRFTNVNFAYDDNDNNELIIKNMSVDFKPRSCNAIVGETGSGKTTLLRLILALIEPTSGSIEIYNSSTTQRLSPRHRVNLVYVPQGNKLMSGTIRDNLLMGNPHATDEQMRQALTTACAQFVMEWPDGLDTSISEGGAGLSEGQAQRIAIARALLRDGNILVFDEATSAIDPDTERILLDNILNDHLKTVIFVTHRMAVCNYATTTLHLT